MKDPVCKMDANENSQFKSDYKNKKYYFCSLACKQSFERNPENYVK